MSNRKYEIIPVKCELPMNLDGTYRKPMSKKRWKQPNEFIWTLVFMVGFFMMSADSFAVLLLALGVMAFSCFKLKDIDLSEECNTSFNFNRR